MKSLTVAILIVLVLTACGSSMPKTTPTAIPSQPTQDLSSGTVFPAKTPALNGATLLERRCSVCHSAHRPKHAKKTREQWEETVTRMISHGAQLTDTEKTILVDYLATTYKP